MFETLEEQMMAAIPAEEINDETEGWQVRLFQQQRGGDMEARPAFREAEDAALAAVIQAAIDAVVDKEDSMDGQW